MTVSSEKLMAFIDGQLPPAESLAVEKLIAEDTALSAYVERQQALKSVLVGAFDSILSEDIPPTILYTFQQATAPAPPKRRPSLAPFFARWRTDKIWFAGTALAGVVIGAIIMTGLSSPELLRNEGGTIIAQGMLAEALSSELAANTVANPSARIGVTFRAHGGRFCRTFESEGNEGALAGIACKVDTQWRVAVLSATEKSQAGIFQQASSALPESIRDAVAAMMEGAPLDADAERLARDRGWNDTP